jgi:hypothetical protein
MPAFSGLDFTFIKITFMPNTKLRNADGTRALVRRVIKNSETIKLGDFVTNESTGMANVDATSEKVEGFVVDIVTRNGVSLRAASVDTSLYTGTFTASTASYAASATNADSGGDGVQVEFVEIREGDEIVATLDAAKGTTTGSNKAGYFLSILTSDSSKLDESSASTSRASTQFEIMDPMLAGSTTEVAVRVSVRGGDQYTAD